MDVVALRHYLVYDPLSPSGLRWRIDGPRFKAGEVAGRKLKDGRWQVQNKVVGDKILYVHRIIWRMHRGIVDGWIVDHRDGNPSNNRLSNLRRCSRSVNNRNVKRRVDNSTGITGVARGCKPTPKSEGWFWAARWNDLTGRECCVKFSEGKYGAERAKQLAIEARTQAIERLNRQGAGYSNRHGT